MKKYRFTFKTDRIKNTFFHEVINCRTAEALENSRFWGIYDAVCRQLREFEFTVNSEFTQPDKRFRCRRNTRCSDLYRKALYFERLANAFNYIANDILRKDIKCTTQFEREKCLLYTYTRLKELIDEIEYETDRARSVPAEPRRRVVRSNRKQAEKRKD